MTPFHTWLSVVLAVLVIGNTSTLALPPRSPVHLIFKKASQEHRLIPYSEGHCTSVEIDTPKLLQMGDLRDVAFANMHNEILFGIVWRKGIWLGRVDSSKEHLVYGYHLQRVPNEGNEEETILEQQILSPLIGSTPCELPQGPPWADSNRPTLTEAWAIWTYRGATINTGDPKTDTQGFIWAPQKRMTDRSYVDEVANPHLVQLLRDTMRAQVDENLPIRELKFKRSPTTNPEKTSRAWILGARFQRDIRSAEAEAEADIASIFYIGAETIFQCGSISPPK